MRICVKNKIGKKHIRADFLSNKSVTLHHTLLHQLNMLVMNSIYIIWETYVFISDLTNIKFDCII